MLEKITSSKNTNILVDLKILKNPPVGAYVYGSIIIDR